MMAPIALGVRGLGVGRRDSGVWTPALPLPVSGLYPDHWYRSDQGVWQDAGITPATSDGDVVGRWEDITANADHVNQAAAGNKPTLQNGAGDLLNGHAVVRFDGIDDYLQGAFTTGGAMAQPNTIIAVSKLSVNVQGTTYTMFDGDDVNHRHIFYKNVALTPDGWAEFITTVVNGTIAADTQWHIFTILFNTIASRFWTGGLPDGGPGNTGNHTLDGITLGASQPLTTWFPGDITEIILYDANLSDADKNTVGNYLATRYALAYTDI